MISLPSLNLSVFLIKAATSPVPSFPRFSSSGLRSFSRRGRQANWHSFETGPDATAILGSSRDSIRALSIVLLQASYKR
jgi:hypothetical protein